MALGEAPFIGSTRGLRRSPARVVPKMLLLQQRCGAGCNVGQTYCQELKVPCTVTVPDCCCSGTCMRMFGERSQ